MLDSINSMMNDSNRNLAAQNLNDAINDTNNVEYYLKTVNTLHMNYLSTGEISHADSTMFDDIAHTPLSLAGEAVYIAAAHIGIEIHQQCDGTARKANIINENKIQLSHNEVFMYPNPAFDKAYFHLMPLIDGQIVLVEIYDNTGNKIMVMPAPTDKIFEVDVRNLASGIYSYKVICNTKIFAGSFSKSR